MSRERRKNVGKLKRDRRMGKMKVLLPLVKEIEEVEIDEEMRDQRTGEIVDRVGRHKVTVRDDGAAFLNLLQQIDWNKSENKKYRKDLSRVMSAIRKFNFENSRTKSIDGSVEIEWERAKSLKKLLCDEYPSDLPVQGLNTLISLDELENWHDVKLAEINLAEKDGADGE